MRPTASDTARALGRSAETVCRHYLSHGRRTGGYWIVGDVLNSPGRSLFVRLHGPECGPGASGKWTDYVQLHIRRTRQRASMAISLISSASRPVLPLSKTPSRKRGDS
jgi:hypothetical protein